MNGTMLEYRVPRFSDMARNIDLKLAQNQDGVGPYGAKGGGEGSVNPIGPCLANALYRHRRAHPEAAADSRTRVEGAAGEKAKGVEGCSRRMAPRISRMCEGV